VDVHKDTSAVILLVDHMYAKIDLIDLSALEAAKWQVVISLRYIRYQRSLSVRSFEICTVSYLVDFSDLAMLGACGICVLGTVEIVYCLPTSVA
jgi:hypothetical protein